MQNNFSFFMQDIELTLILRNLYRFYEMKIGFLLNFYSNEKAPFCLVLNLNLFCHFLVFQYHRQNVIFGGNFEIY